MFYLMVGSSLRGRNGVGQFGFPPAHPGNDAVCSRILVLWSLLAVSLGGWRLGGARSGVSLGAGFGQVFVYVVRSTSTTGE